MNSFKPHKAFKKCLAVVFILITSNLFSQIGIINDPDGFTNVRKEANSNSEIIHVLKENEMFYYDVTLMNKVEWIEIYIPKSKFLHSPYYDPKDVPLLGYIHKSRLKYFGDLNKLNSNNFSFKYTLQKFNPKNKIITYYNSKETYQAPTINGQYIYGTDGGLPEIETVDITVYIDSIKINIPKVLYENLYECTNDFDINVNNDCYYVSQWNSDGAGAYMVVWAIDKTGLLQRLIFIP